MLLDVVGITLILKVWNWTKVWANNSQHFFCSAKLSLSEARQCLICLHSSPNIVGAFFAHCAWSPKSYGLHPSLNELQVPTLLHPIAHHCQHGHNNSQHCWPNDVNSCCVSLHRLHPQSLIWIFIFENKDFLLWFQLKNIHVHAHVV